MKQYKKANKANINKIGMLSKLKIHFATGYPVRACIKTYDFLHKENCTKVITLARSGQLNVNNMISEHFVQIDINDNTDFKLVFRNNVKYVGDRENYFFINDLIKYSKDNEYKNSNDKWKEYYTTINEQI